MKELWHIVSKRHHFYLSSAFFLFDLGFLKINKTEIFGYGLSVHTRIKTRPKNLGLSI